MNRTWLRSRAIDIGARLIRTLDSFLGRSSKVGDRPIFDSSQFPWARTLELNWEKMRQELDLVLADPDSVPPFQEISRDQKHLTSDNNWKTFFFFAYGFRAERNCQLCPETVRLLEDIPGMTTAFFSILAPGKHLPDHRGTFKGVLRYHLGLLVPREKEKCRMRVDNEYRHWEEGRSLIFDDTFRHEVWNDTDSTRAVLFVDFVRPLRFPANVMNRAIIGAIKHSPFVSDAVSNYQAWESKFERSA